MGVWTNADKPEEAAQARSYGAQGIGLCRTEHMFREGDRLEIVRGAILVANVATRAKAKRAAGDTLTADEQEAVVDLRRRDGEARGPPAGRLRGHLQGDGRAARRHPAHRPAPPRVPPQPRGAAGQGDPGRGARRGLGGGQAAPRDDQVAARAEPDAGPARLPPGADDPGLREDPDPGDPQRADRGPQGGRQPDRQDHDPARRARERAVGDARAAGGRGRGRPRGGRRHRRRLQVRHDDRGAARRAHGGRDRRPRRLLQLRHQRPDPDDVRLQPRRRRGRVPAQVRRGRHPARQPVPDARRRGRRADEGGGRQGPGDASRASSSASAASTAATRSRSTSASGSGSTTCPARRSGCRSPASRPRRPSSANAAENDR